MVSCARMNERAKQPELPWIEKLDAERANEAEAILTDVLEQLEGGASRARISAYADDTPPSPAIGSDEHWIERRVRVVRALENKGFIRMFRRDRHSGPMVPDHERGEWIVIDAREDEVRAGKEALEARKRHVVADWYGKSANVTSAFPKPPEVVAHMMKHNAAVAPPKNVQVETTPQLEALRTILRRFHLVTQELRRRHDGRQRLEIKDEYDVQDLLRALLRVHVGDIRPEEGVPSLGGASAKGDFFLKNEGVIVEAKMTRENLGNAELVKQLNDDLQKYPRIPGCNRLMVLIYDPELRVKNPDGLETDYRKEDPKFSCEVFVVPKGL